jgi:hypothetical protein
MKMAILSLMIAIVGIYGLIAYLFTPGTPSYNKQAGIVISCLLIFISFVAYFVGLHGLVMMPVSYAKTYNTLIKMNSGNSPVSGSWADDALRYNNNVKKWRLSNVTNTGLTFDTWGYPESIVTQVRKDIIILPLIGESQ